MVVALVAAVMMMDMVAVGTAIMDLVMMEAVFGGKIYNDFGNSDNQSSWTLDRRKPEDKGQALVVVEASTLPNLETKMARVVQQQQ